MEYFTKSRSFQTSQRDYPLQGMARRIQELNQSVRNSQAPEATAFREAVTDFWEDFVAGLICYSGISEDASIRLANTLCGDTWEHRLTRALLGDLDALRQSLEAKKREHSLDTFEHTRLRLKNDQQFVQTTW